MCNYFTVPINLGYSKDGVKWNYFEEMPKKEYNRIETFLYNKMMKTGDYVLLYITKKGLNQISTKEAGYDKTYGVYAIGRILASPPQKMDDPNDRNAGEIVIQVDIEYYNLKEPLANFPSSVKPTTPNGRPFMINNIDRAFIKKIENAKSNAQFKPII